MTPNCLRSPPKQLIWIVPLIVFNYLLIGQSLMPAGLKAKKPRNILSVEHRYQNANHQKSSIIEQEKVRENMESVAELVEDEHDVVLERIRSPDIGMQRDGTTMITVTLMEYKRPADNATLFDELESELRNGKELDDLTQLCPRPENNKKLIGHLPQALLLITNLKESEVLKHHPNIKPGGHWKPNDCVSEHKIAVIIPFRDRQTHLTRLIDFLIPVLSRQRLDFRFIVTEQYGKDLFNKGRIMNAAFRLAEQLDVNCVIFHDVDMFPQDDRNFYGCPPTPRHMGAYVNNLGYQLWYNEIVGGVLAISMDDYRSVNGYSNMYWAWGGEDDDMGKRILAQNLTIERPDTVTGGFTMLKHLKRKRIAPKLIFKLLDDAGTRYHTDGLNVTSWKILKITLRPLYYHMYVDVGKAPSEWT